MGIVVRQSFWGTLTVYTGVAIGFITTLLINPAFLSVDEIGLIRLIQSNALMIVPVALLGLNGSFIKYYPNFKSDLQLRNKIITFQLSLMGLMCLIITLVVALSPDWIGSFFQENSPKYLQYLYVSVLILISQSFFDYFNSFLWSQMNVIFQNFIQEVALRIVNLIVVILFGLEIIPFDLMVQLLALSYLMALGVLFIYAFIKYRVRLDFGFDSIPKDQMRQLIGFGIFTMTLTCGASIFNNVSYAMTSSYLGLSQNGILTIGAFIATIIELPKRAVTQIMSPIISQNLKENDIDKIQINYRKASINLSIIGGLLSIGILSNLDDLFLIIPQGEVFKEGKTLITFFAVARLINMCFGLGPEILSYSKYYFRAIYVMILGSLVMITTNMVLIPTLGIAGVGLAFLLTTIVSQSTRLGIIYRQFGIYPFSVTHLRLLAVILGVGGLAFLLPLQFHPIVNIGLRSLVTVSAFFGLVYFMKLSYQVNTMIDLILAKIFR